MPTDREPRFECRITKCVRTPRSFARIPASASSIFSALVNNFFNGCDLRGRFDRIIIHPQTPSVRSSHQFLSTTIFFEVFSGTGNRGRDSDYILSLNNQPLSIDRVTAHPHRSDVRNRLISWSAENIWSGNKIRRDIWAFLHLIP